jgi:hypothetical protein
MEYHNRLLNGVKNTLGRWFDVSIVLLVLFASLGVIEPAKAENGLSDGRESVSLRLQAEGWVVTDHGDVAIEIDLAVPAGHLNQSRSAATDALLMVSPKANWRVVDFRKLKDEAGFERWWIAAEACLPEAVLAELPQRLENASQPGLSLRLRSLNYQPSVAEIEAARARLRVQIYETAKAELARLNEVFGSDRFTLGTIDLDPDFGLVRPMTRDVASKRVFNAPEATPALGGQMARRLVLTALVELVVE